LSLATRCTACGTTFKVVQDQLKVSAGWVRCGRCNEVFNAIEGLFEVGAVTSATPAASPPMAPQAAADVAAIPAPQAAEAAAESSLSTSTPMPTPASVSVLVPVSSALPESPAQVTGWRVEVNTAAPADRLPNDSPEPTPDFVRQAEQAQRWRRPGVRQGLASAAVLLTLALGAQVALESRDTLAAEWPTSRPWLALACELTGCQIEPLRRIAAMSVESSGLDQLGTTTIYKLSAVLRNRGDVELMLPALDLVLSDAQGAVIARRVLSAAELGSPSRTLAARAELSLQASLNTGDRRVAGYTIEIFYP
jgi:predicted Zn finger-like uncharacterized protein